MGQQSLSLKHLNGLPGWLNSKSPDLRSYRPVMREQLIIIFWNTWQRSRTPRWVWTLWPPSTPPPAPTTMQERDSASKHWAQQVSTSQLSKNVKVFSNKSVSGGWRLIIVPLYFYQLRCLACVLFIRWVQTSVWSDCVIKATMGPGGGTGQGWLFV